MMEDPVRRDPALLRGSFLGEVVSVADPDGRGRVQVRLFAFDGVDDHDAPLWARVATPFAGADRGAFFIPDVGDEVLVTFAHGDPRALGENGEFPVLRHRRLRLPHHRAQ